MNKLTCVSTRIAPFFNENQWRIFNDVYWVSCLHMYLRLLIGKLNLPVASKIRTNNSVIIFVLFKMHLIDEELHE